MPSRDELKAKALRDVEIAREIVVEKLLLLSSAQGCYGYSSAIKALTNMQNALQRSLSAHSTVVVKPKNVNGNKFPVQAKAKSRKKYKNKPRPGSGIVMMGTGQTRKVGSHRNTH